MGTNRETQFVGFAKKLNKEINDFAFSFGMVAPDPETLRQGIEKIIAQRAYDLVQHALGHNLEYLHECGRLVPALSPRMVNAVPDLPELPPEPITPLSPLALPRHEKHVRKIGGIDVEAAMNTPVFRSPFGEQLERETKQ